MTTDETMTISSELVPDLIVLFKQAAANGIEQIEVRYGVEEVRHMYFDEAAEFEPEDKTLPPEAYDVVEKFAQSIDLELSTEMDHKGLGGGNITLHIGN